MKASLPWRGLALSSNLNALESPRPYRLLDAHPGLFDALEYSAPLDLEQARREASLFATMDARRAEVPVLFHPVHLNLYGPELESTEVLAQLDAHAKAVGSAWVGNDVAWWHGGGQAFPGYLYVAPSFDEDAVATCVAHAQHVQSHLSVPLALENPAVLVQRGPMHVLDFMAALHAKTGAPLLLDLGHLWSFQLAAGLPPNAGLDGFPLDQVIEIHIAGGVVTRHGSRALYVDDHTQPIREELFTLLEQLLPRCTRLRCLTYEGDGHADAIAVRNLQRLRGWIPREVREEVAVELEANAAPSNVEPSPAWALFRRCHEETPERDFRLAVIAEQLDRHYPLTRALLAGTPARLAAFATSDLYRSGFEGEGKSLQDTFGAWARRELLKTADEAMSAVLAFEMAALHRASHASPQTTPGKVSLGAGVTVGSFPLDLAELIAALRTLKRHLSQRAWASGVLETDGLEALGQLARRAKTGTWQHALRRRDGAWEAIDVTPSNAELFQAAIDRAPVETFLTRLDEAMGRELSALVSAGWIVAR